MRPIDNYLIIKRRQQREGRWHQCASVAARRAGWGLGALLGLTLASLVLGAILAYAGLTRDLPSLTVLPALLDPPDGLLLKPTQIYDRTGEHLLLALDNGITGTRKVLSLDASNPEHLPQTLVQATLSTADPGFWSQPGFLFNDLTSDHISTLAESLVSNLLLSNEPPSLKRNLRVRLLAAQVTASYGRERILEWYLNSVNYGHLAYGAEAAAQLYLGKSASQLNLAESALLAAVAQAPGLNPIDAPSEALANQRQVIASMLEQGVITQKQANQALGTVIVFIKQTRSDTNPAVAFTNMVQNEVANLVGKARLERGGLVILTTLDYDLQLQLDCTLRTQLMRITDGSAEEEAQINSPSGAVDCTAARLLPTLSEPLQLGQDVLEANGLILDPQTGEVLAMVGDTTSTSGESPFLSAHPTGSLLTPFIYLAGFTRGMSPGTLVWDVPSSLPPTLSNQVNPDNKFHGPVRLRIALANDYLAPAAQLLAQIGPDVVWSSTAAFGLPSFLGDPVPFSGGGLTILEVGQAFGVLANRGVMAGQVQQDKSSLQPVGLLQVQDSSGMILADWSQPSEQSIISEPLTYLMNQSLSDETARWPSLGSSNPLGIGRPTAAKLGQTADGLDTWTVGYTPQRVGAVWIGAASSVSATTNPAAANNSGQESSNSSLKSGKATNLDLRWAAGAWHAIMQYASNNLPVTGWSTPAGISTVEVCDPSGLLPTPSCPNVVNEVFLTGNEPTTQDNLYQTFEINRETGLLATVFTPPALVVQKTYLVVPSDERQWTEVSGLAIPPDHYDVIQAPVVLADAHITSPALFDAVHGVVKIVGTASGDNFASYQIQVGQGLNPKEWVQVGATSQKSIAENALATWDTTQMDDGLYAVRLLVVQKNQEVETAIIQVTVDNTLPLVNAPYPTAGQVFNYKAGLAITLQAQASDEIGLTRVEWWIDGNLVGTLMQGPFSTPWTATPGNHTLVVKAYDRAGNVGQTAPIQFTVKK